MIGRQEVAQRFVGAWTEEKLECLKKYFRAYQAILKKNTDFPLIYIDAFAGTGVREDPEGAQIYREGSALIALRDGGFDEYWLAESLLKTNPARRNATYWFVTGTTWSRAGSTTT